MSLILTALIVGGGALIAGAAARLSRRHKPEPPQAKPREPEDRRVESELIRLGFEIELGDVVEIGGRELWLERAWLFSEAGDAVAALFSAREATLVVSPPPARRVWVLDEVEIALPPEPPATLESRGVRFERARRIPVTVKALGKSPPLPWDQAVFAEYRGLAGDALFTLGKDGRAKAWQGRIASDSEIERWGGGERTLE